MLQSELARTRGWFLNVWFLDGYNHLLFVTHVSCLAGNDPFVMAGLDYKCTVTHSRTHSITHA